MKHSLLFTRHSSNAMRHTLDFVLSSILFASIGNVPNDVSIVGSSYPQTCASSTVDAMLVSISAYCFYDPLLLLRVRFVTLLALS